MIACISSPPDAAPVSNRHIARSRALHGHRVWVPWLPFFTRAQAKRCLYAAIQLSRCRVILIFPFTIYGVSEAFFHPLLTEDANHSLICPKFRAKTRFVLDVLSNPSGTIRKVQYTLSPIWNKHRLLANVIKLTIIGKNTGVCSRDSGILLFNLGLERHDKQTDQKICL